MNYRHDKFELLGEFLLLDGIVVHSVLLLVWLILEITPECMIQRQLYSNITPIFCSAKKTLPPKHLHRDRGGPPLQITTNIEQTNK